MTRFFQILIDCLPAVIDADAAWTTKPRLFEALRQLEAGNGVRVYDVTVEDGLACTHTMTAREITEDIAIDMADAADMGDWNEDSQPCHVFSAFAYANAEDHCESRIREIESRWPRRRLA